MDNLIFRLLLQSWPVILAAIATVLLIYHWMRPKFTLEKLQKGLVRQTVLVTIGDESDSAPDPEQQEWIAVRENIQDQFSTTFHPANKGGKLNYRSYLCLSLIWVLFWSGAFAFLTIRILVAPYYYGSEAIYLGYFAYYICLGLIGYFKK